MVMNIIIIEYQIYINKRRQTLHKFQIHSFDKYIKTNKGSKIDFIYNFNFNKYK